MPVEHRTGDLFNQPDLDPATSGLAQGVNCLGKMGAGIAPLFKRKFAGMYDDYAAACSDGTLTVGGLHVWRSPNPADPWIYNLASQHHLGADARLDAITTSLIAAVVHAEANGVTAIALPRIGAGIGGLTWPEVSAIYDRTAAQTDVRLIAISLPGADG